MKLRPGVALLPAVMIFPLLGGCIASVKVTKVPAVETAPGVAGVRYSLPAAFILVKPDPAKTGNYAVETKLFADPTETYAIDSTAYLSTATLNVEVAEGLLTKVTINQNTSDLGSEAVKAASEVVKTDLEQRKKEKEDAETARKEAAKELAALQAAVSKAEDELLIARRSVAEWEALVSLAPENATYQLGLRQAKVDQAKAEIALQRANQALTERLAQQSGGGASDVSDSVGGGSPPGAAQPTTTADAPTRKSPVLYRLVDTCDVHGDDKAFATCKVDLVPVDWDLQKPMPQLDLPVRTVKPKAPTPKQPELVDIQITPEPVSFVKGLFRKQLVLSAPVCSIVVDESTLKTVDPETGAEADVPISKLGLTLLTGKANVDLLIHEKALDPATYYLTLQILWGDCTPGKETPGTIGYQFRISP